MEKVYTAENQRLELFQICARGQINKAEEFVLKYPKYDLNEPGGFSKRTAMHWAAICGNSEMIKWLAEHGFPGKPDRDLNTPLHLAAMNGHLAAVQELRGRKDLKNRHGQLAYDVAKTNEIRKLLDPDPQKEKKPLIVETDMDIYDAAEMGDLKSLSKECAKSLGRLNGPEFQWRRAPLHYAAMTNNSEAASILLENLAKVDPVDSTGWTPLHWASNNGHLEVALVLRKYGANLKIKTQDSMQTPEELAKKPIMKNLLQANKIEMFNWLRELELDNYCQIFATSEVTMDILPSLSEEDLKAMGLQLGARRKVLNAVKKMIDAPIPIPKPSNLEGIGKVYLSDIKILEKIGSGAWGQVFKGKWGGTNTVALKKVTNESSSSVKEFEYEITVLKELRHPNVILLYGLYHQDTTYIVMEYCSDGSLDKLLQTADFTLRQILMIAMDVCAGMNYLSSKNIVHRDLAARNLLAKKDHDRYMILVSDFGLSRLMINDEYEATTRRFPVKWTAPEAIQFGKFSTKSDIYSYGIVLWEIFSHGALPWSTLDNKETSEVVLKGEKQAKPTNCPPDMYDIMVSCWNQDPQARPDWRAIYGRIEEIVASLPNEPEESNPNVKSYVL